MGFFNYLGLPEDNKLSDRDQGLKALRYYHDKASQEPSFTLSFGELVERLDARAGDPISALGLGINVADISESRVRDAMSTLALDSKGGIPQSGAFTQSLTERVQKLDLEAFKEIAKDTAIDTAKVAMPIIGSAILIKIIIAIAVGVAVKKLTDNKKCKK